MEKRFKILMATDYSELTISAESYAINLALNMNATLIFLHVYSIPLMATPSQPSAFARTREEFRNTEVYRLEQHRLELCRVLGISSSALDSQCIVREGNVVKEICHEVAESEIDLIVVGTHGQSGLRNVIFGSHTWNLIRRSAIPVFAIPPSQVFSRIKNIVYATEDRKAEIDALNFVADLGAFFDADITLFHIANFSSERKVESEIFENFKKDVERNCSYERIFFRFGMYEDVTKGLNDFALRMQADLVVMCPKRMLMIERFFTFNPSQTKKMTHNALLPLLAIPDNYMPVKQEVKFLD